MSAPLDTMKPLGRKAYGSIPHLSGSRFGPKDYRASPGHEDILTLRARKGDEIVVEEKLDGSCCAVANIDGAVVPLIRAGYRADASSYRQHHLFAAWVYARQDAFGTALGGRELLAGEWLLQAHGAFAPVEDEALLFRPFDAFDMKGRRRGRDALEAVCRAVGIEPVPLLHRGEAISVHMVLPRLAPGSEGAVWRCENRRWGVEFLAKFVRPGKVDGLYLPSVSGGSEVWNFPPERVGATP